MSNDGQVAGVILAGGRSRRMAGGVKAFADLAGNPMLIAVRNRIQPQVEPLLLSVEKPAPEWEPFGLEQVPDPTPGSCGPLGGLLAALEKSRFLDAAFLALVPCDAPFLPLDLVSRLEGQAGRQSKPVTVVRYGEVVQPVFSLWSTGLVPILKEAVMERGMAGFHQFLRQQDHAILDWPEEPRNPFFNINDRDALSQARQRLRQAKEQEQCSK